jgi:hypothetical protein
MPPKGFKPPMPPKWYIKLLKKKPALHMLPPPPAWWPPYWGFKCTNGKGTGKPCPCCKVIRKFLKKHPLPKPPPWAKLPPRPAKKKTR